MTRILVIDEALPHPPDSGKRIRTWELLRRLARLYEIKLVYSEEGDTPATAVEAARAADIEPLAVPRRQLKKKGARFAWDLLRNLALPVPYMVMAHRTRALCAAIRDQVATWKPDLIHVEWTPLTANIPSDNHIPVCVSAHNVESDIWARYLENETSFARRRYIALQLRKVRAFELKALGGASAVTAVSENDADRIRSWTGQAHVTVVPNGVNADYFSPDPDVEVQPHEILFVGSLDWRPNLDAVTWFLDEILKPLRAREPRAVFQVVGRNAPQWLLDRAKSIEGVEVHGSVPDVRPFVARAAVCAVPLRIGGGSRLKICEALSMERPVVSTTVGAEGLDLSDGIVTADGAEAFAKALAETLANPAAAKARAMTGHKRVMKRYEWDRIAPIQASVWNNLSEASTRGIA